LIAVTEMARRVGGATAAILDPEGTGDFEHRPPPASYEAYQLWAEGSRWSADGDWERAWVAFQHAYALDTTFLRALTSAATMRENANQFTVADSLLRFVERRRDRLTRAEALQVEALQANLAGDNERLLVADREAARLLPPLQGLYNWGWAAVAANHPEEAVYAFTKASPDYRAGTDWPYGCFFLAAAWHLLGRHEEELKVARAGRRAFPTSLVTVSAELRALAALGRDDDVFRLLDEARHMSSEAPNLSEYWGGAGPWQPYEAALELRAHGRQDGYRRAIAQALEMASAAEGSDTGNVATRSGRAMVLYAAERWGEARAAYAALLGVDSTNLNYLGGLAVSEARLGHRNEAEALARRLATMNPPYSNGRSPFWRARIAALLGDRDDAVALLREAIAHGIGCAVHSGMPDEDCHREMDFEALRGYAPFDELLRPKT
jgi:tetratricopeptide (TPR) repeat protein